MDLNLCLQNQETKTKVTQHDHLNNARKQSKAIFFYNLQISLDQDHNNYNLEAPDSQVSNITPLSKIQSAAHNYQKTRA
jgi:hypothetical protein